MKSTTALTAEINIALEDDCFAYIDAQPDRGRGRLVRFLVTELVVDAFPGWDPAVDDEVEILGRCVPYLKDGTLSTSARKRWLTIPFQSLPDPVQVHLVEVVKQAFLPE